MFFDIVINLSSILDKEGSALAFGVDELNACEDGGVLIEGMGTTRGDQPQHTTGLKAQPRLGEAGGTNLSGLMVMISGSLSILTNSMLEDPGVDAGVGEGNLTLYLFLFWMSLIASSVQIARTQKSITSMQNQVQSVKKRKKKKRKEKEVGYILRTHQLDLGIV